jgi:L-cystine uptake protein TcyP (sodium:dicarboxylate symporter family)
VAINIVIHVQHTCQVSRVTLQGIKSRSHAQPHYSQANTKSTNWKISVKLIKLLKQNSFAQYGNSDLLSMCCNVVLSQLVTVSKKHIRSNKLNGVRTFNCEWSRHSCKKRHKKVSGAPAYNIKFDSKWCS